MVKKLWYIHLPGDLNFCNKVTRNKNILDFIDIYKYQKKYVKYILKLCQLEQKSKDFFIVEFCYSYSM